MYCLLYELTFIFIYNNYIITACKCHLLNMNSSSLIRRLKVINCVIQVYGREVLDWNQIYCLEVMFWSLLSFTIRKWFNGSIEFVPPTIYIHDWCPQCAIILIKGWNVSQLEIIMINIEPLTLTSHTKKTMGYESGMIQQPKVRNYRKYRINETIFCSLSNKL